MKISILYDNGEKQETTEYKVINGENLTCKVTKVEIQYNQNTNIKTELAVNVAHDMKEATCTENAKCKVEGCGYIKEGSALGHKNETKVTAPTCTQKGYTTHRCTRCEETYVDTYTEKLGHSFTNYISNNDATCTEDGTKTAKCDRCEARDTTGDIGSKLGHSFTNYISNNDATCTEDGTKTAKCDRCEARDTTGDIGSKLGHSFTNYVSNNDSTCTEDGTKTAKCDRCEARDTTGDIGSKLGHSFTNYISNNDATCTKDGTKTAKCDRCEERKTVTEENSKKSHHYENGECTGCGQKEIEAEIEIETEKYSKENQYITKIKPKTKVKDFKSNIQTNATEIKIYNKNQQTLGNEDIIGTGMVLELKRGNKVKTFTLVVKGDTNADGKADFKDLVKINSHRLNKKRLVGAYVFAADVNEDGKVDLKDIVKINRFRLNKIVEL